jgi:thiamine biosynthesis lipoprotein
LLIPACRVAEKWHSSTFLFFDTICEIKAFCTQPAFLASEEEVRMIFSETEKHFAPGAKDFSSPIILNLFHRALDVYNNTGGCFDITVGPLSRAWGFRTGTPHVAHPEQIAEALSHVGMDKITEEGARLLLQPGMELDWGGIAKGLGIDLASRALIRSVITRGFINAGGDLYCWGENPDNQAWQVGIKHPRAGGFLGVLALSDKGAATTGDYQRFFMEEGVRHHHVFDPKTGLPSRGKQSVTVVGPETLLCDALSTAVFVSREPKAILDKYPDYGAIIVDSDGRISLVGKIADFRKIE